MGSQLKDRKEGLQQMSLEFSTSSCYVSAILNQSGVEISNAVPPSQLVSQPEAHQHATFLIYRVDDNWMDMVTISCGIKFIQEGWVNFSAAIIEDDQYLSEEHCSDLSGEQVYGSRTSKNGTLPNYKAPEICILYQ